MNDELATRDEVNCDYCGTSLNARLYFCPACAKPFRSVEQVIPASLPKYEDSETKIRTKAKDAWNVFFIYMIVMSITGFLGISIWGYDNLSPVIILSDVAIGITTMILMWRYWQDLKPQFTNFTGMIKPASWIGLVALAPLLALNFAYHGLLLDWLDMEEMNFNDFFTSKWGLIITICVMPAITEEIAYRGIIQHHFEKIVSPAMAIGVASLVFSAAHLSILSGPYLALVGALLGWMKYKTGSIYPPMVAHFLHNYIVITWS